MQESATEPKPTVEAFPLNTTAGGVGSEIERVCSENELIITTWSPIHLRERLKEFYWKDGSSAAGAMTFWEDSLRYLYLPRFKSRDVLAQAIRSGASSGDFFGTAYGLSGDKYDGFKIADPSVQFDDTLLLIELGTARAYEEAHRPPPPGPTPPGPVPPGPGVTPPGPTPPTGVTPPLPATKPRSFHGTAEINAATAKVSMVQLAEEIIGALTADPNATVKVTVEIAAEFPQGASDQTKRAVSENARSLGLKAADWE